MARPGWCFVEVFPRLFTLSVNAAMWRLGQARPTRRGRGGKLFLLKTKMQQARACRNAISFATRVVDGHVVEDGLRQKGQVYPCHLRCIRKSRHRIVGKSQVLVPTVDDGRHWPDGHDYPLQQRIVWVRLCLWKMGVESGFDPGGQGRWCLDHETGHVQQLQSAIGVVDTLRFGGNYRFAGQRCALWATQALFRICKLDLIGRGIPPGCCLVRLRSTPSNNFCRRGSDVSTWCG